MSSVFTHVNSFRFCNIQSARISRWLMRSLLTAVCKHSAHVGVNRLILQDIVRFGEISRLTCQHEPGKLFLRRGFPMSSLVNGTPTTSSAPESAQEKPGFRTKTIATRITPEELREVEAAAEKSGKTLAVWLRELALKAARERPADPTELLLAEIMALRYTLLNLFHGSATAQAEGKYLLPESVVKIRDKAETRKLADARKLLTDFLTGEDRTGGQR